MTEDRQAALQSFLQYAGWENAAVRPLAGDASNRRYLRLAKAGKIAVLMDAPPVTGEDCRPFIAMTEWLRASGLSAPEVLAIDLDQGFLVLEDLGDNLFVRRLADTPTDETEIYSVAIRVLARLADLPPPPSIGSDPDKVVLPPYNIAALMREAALLTEWWIPTATGEEVPEDLIAEYTAIVTNTMAPVSNAREVVVLRDYHAENLLWLPDRQDLRRVGLLDYQDALSGHPAYDLVSLLEDARRDTSAALREAMIALYLDMRPDLNPEEFRLAYAILGAQRNMKIVGIFARLAKRDGKAGYLNLIPRVWDHLQRDLAHQALAPLAAWLRDHVPVPDAANLAMAKINAGARL
ncbi:MAG: phosphotransferase [Pseudomonadota bacterium]